jgi:hypothetical protein
MYYFKKTKNKKIRSSVAGSSKSGPTPDPVEQRPACKTFCFKFDGEDDASSAPSI